MPHRETTAVREMAPGWVTPTQRDDMTEACFVVPSMKRIGEMTPALRIEAQHAYWPPHLVDAIQDYAEWLYAQEAQRGVHDPVPTFGPRLHR